MIITARAPSLSFMLIPYRGLGEAVAWTPFVLSGSKEVGEVGIRAVPDYEEFIGAKKHLVLGSLSHAGSPPKGSCSFAIG
jgi:hypothetical protein